MAGSPRRATSRSTRLFRRILVPVDFAPPSEAAVETAVALARRFGAILSIVHVLDVASPPYVEGATLAALRRDSAARLRDVERKVALAAMRADRPPRWRVLLREGATAREILRTAQADRTDLIVIGSHARRGLSRFFLGSTAEEVIRRATCPVVVVKANAASLRGRAVAGSGRRARATAARARA